ncbi:DUF4974 domain-containing protein [Flavihumibacter sp. R14]|nr:DUF4974 domain-containing protein [Flavihumibacter soli]
MEKKEVKDLLTRYRSGKITEEERALLESWYLQHQETDGNEYLVSERIEDASDIWARLRVDEPKMERISLWSRVAAAALVLAVLSFGLYFCLKEQDRPESEYIAKPVKEEILPGGNNAILTLADGRKISLTEAKNGELVRESGIVVTKASDGQLVYTVSASSSSTSELKFNTIETPKGGQYQVLLPDGSNVWLNAASSLKYPAAFAKTERRVELQGEAYFEVASDKSKPFLVSTAGQTVEVLGTHFNVSSYADEQSTKTTLLKGSVRVTASGIQKVIQPGQQSVLAENSLQVKAADIEETMAWKNGYFRFNDAKIDDVVLKLSRWYDVDFRFDGEKSAERFNGVISRSKNLSQVLKMLEKTKAIHFKTERRRITVMK